MASLLKGMIPVAVLMVTPWPCGALTAKSFEF